MQVALRYSILHYVLMCLCMQNTLLYVHIDMFKVQSLLVRWLVNTVGVLIHENFIEHSHAAATAIATGHVIEQ